MRSDRFNVRVDPLAFNGRFTILSDKAFRTYLNVRLLMATNGMAEPDATCHISLVQYAAGSGRGCRKAVTELIEYGFITVDPSDTVHFAKREAQLVDIRPKSGPRPSIANTVRLHVYQRDEFACVICGETDDLTLDHIVPYSHGGDDVPDNLRTLCRRCNTRRGAAKYTDDELRNA